MKVKILKDENHYNYRKILEKINFYLSHLPKAYYNYLYRKKLKTPVILNRKNKLEKLLSSNRKRNKKNIIIQNRKKNINKEKYLFSQKTSSHKQFMILLEKHFSSPSKD